MDAKEIAETDEDRVMATLGWQLVSDSQGTREYYVHGVSGDFVMLRSEVTTLRGYFDKYAICGEYAQKEFDNEICLSIDGMKRMMEAALRDQFDQLDEDGRCTTCPLLLGGYNLDGSHTCPVQRKFRVA